MNSISNKTITNTDIITELNQVMQQNQQQQIYSQYNQSYVQSQSQQVVDLNSLFKKYQGAPSEIYNYYTTTNKNLSDQLKLQMVEEEIMQLIQEHDLPKFSFIQQQINGIESLQQKYIIMKKKIASFKEDQILSSLCDKSDKIKYFIFSFYTQEWIDYKLQQLDQNKFILQKTIDKLGQPQTGIDYIADIEYETIKNKNSMENIIGKKLYEELLKQYNEV